MASNYAYMSSEQLREVVWPYGALWGECRQAVRDYLKKIWKQNVYTHPLETNYENVKREAREILEWWWTNRYGGAGTLDFNRCSADSNFGRWLLQQYNDSVSVNPDDNRPIPPR